MRRFLLTMATAASALAVTSCGDSTGIGTNVAGSYELVRLNGQTLPATDVTGEIIFHAGLLEIDSDGSFAETLQYRFPGDPLIEEETWFGEWDRDGNRIRFEYDQGFVQFGDRASSSRLIVEDAEGNEFDYRRF